MLIAERMGRTGSFHVTFGAHTGIATLPLVYFGTREQRDAVRAVHGDCAEISIDAKRSIYEWGRLLGEGGPPEQLLWIAPEAPAPTINTSGWMGT